LAGDLAPAFGATQDFLLRCNNFGGENREISVQLRNFIALILADRRRRPFPKDRKPFILIGC
jgi:hypothetical protein